MPALQHSEPTVRTIHREAHLGIMNDRRLPVLEGRLRVIGQIPEHVGIISIAYRYTETVVEAESDRGIESHPGTKYGRDKQTIAPTTRSTRLNHLDLITQPENEDVMITVTVRKP